MGNEFFLQWTISQVFVSILRGGAETVLSISNTLGQSIRKVFVFEN